MAAKGENINGCFRCVSYVDIDPGAADIATEVNAWKNTNNYVSNRLAACWPRVAIDSKEMWLSTQLGAISQVVDHKNGDVPMESPSNKNLKMNKTIVKLPGSSQDIMFSKAAADSLNGQGIVTAINWIGGWKAWGNNMSIFPSESDPKDRWIPVRRMTDWLGNSIVLTVYQFVDRPGNRRLIDSIIDSLNIWLNSLVAAGQLLGARVEFRHDENSDTELLAGHYRFHVYEAVPTPAEWIEFLIEFDVRYLSALFSAETTQTPVL
jgi:Bacteriophage tail sheath protein